MEPSTSAHPKRRRDDSSDDVLFAAPIYSQPQSFEQSEQAQDGNEGVQASPSSTALLGTSKRLNVLSWDEYFMAVAFLSSQRSKDPNTQVGACIVNQHRQVIGIGYNGFPTGCSDDELPWARGPADSLDAKYLYVCHAELNAILNKNSMDVRGASIYVALFPCNECAKLIIQSGIREVVYICDKYKDNFKWIASRRLLTMANVELRQYIPKKRRIVIDFDSIHNET